VRMLSPILPTSITQRQSSRLTQPNSLLSLLAASGPSVGNMFFYLGAFRTGSVANSGWQWIDGTSPSNLNVPAGTANWNTGQPE
jgi:hypothetical protein